MKIEQILQLLEAVSRSELTEFKYEDGGVKLSLKKASGDQTAQLIQSAQPTPVNKQSDSSGDKEILTEDKQEKIRSGKLVKSPLVGTFYAAPAEGAVPFVSVGDRVKEGQVLAIVEAMKLMNEIESDFAGTVSEILVGNGEIVEYGQPLFVIN